MPLRHRRACPGGHCGGPQVLTADLEPLDGHGPCGRRLRRRDRAGELPDDASLEGRDAHRLHALLGARQRVVRREVEANEVIVLGHSPRWQGDLRMGCAPMRDALDLGAVAQALRPGWGWRPSRS